jgi:hypothetical protein
MSLGTVRVLVGLLGSFAIAVLLACGDDPAGPTTGLVRVTVYDQGDPSLPVPDVVIDMAPTNTSSRTDSTGLAVFELDPGDYFVDANVCCAGPGFIAYYEPVTVVAGQTKEVQLDACLACVCKPMP